MITVLNPQKFYSDFKCEDDCKQYLFEWKWKDGYLCKRCGFDKAWKGRTEFHRRCQRCGYDESVTANTAFHKIKIPLLKAFGMIFQIAVPKKGKSSNDLGKEIEVNAKTALAFRKKAHSVIATHIYENKGCVASSDLIVDSITITKREEALNGFQRIALRLRKSRNRVPRSKDFLAAECFLPKEQEIDYSQLIGGRFKEEGARMLLWNFKVWLTGVHHHCSFKGLKGYLAEFFFRHNYRSEVDTIWHRLVALFMRQKVNKSSVYAT